MSKQKINETQKQQKTINEQQLLNSISDMKQLMKSIRLSLPKQARRIESIASVFKNPILISYFQKCGLKESDRLTFQQYTDLKGLICEQSIVRFQQIHKQLDALYLEIKKASSAANLKKQQINLDEFIKKFNIIKQKFNNKWKEEYFLILNYKLQISARELERWSCLTSIKTDKPKVSSQIDKLFS